MSLRQLLLAAFLAISTPALAQSPSATSASSQAVNSSQSAAFRSVLSTYSASFKASPQYSGLVADLLFNLPQSVLPSVTQDTASLLPVPTGSAFNLYSFATDPPTSFPELGWESYLSTATNARETINSLRTSAVVALATSAQSVLGTSAAISTSSTSSSSAGAAPTLPPFAGSAIGAAAGLIGAAAVML